VCFAAADTGPIPVTPTAIPERVGVGGDTREEVIQMSITRTATAAVSIAAALSGVLIATTAGTASARPVYCEPAAPYGCTGHSSIVLSGASSAPSVCREQDAGDNHAGVPADLTVGQYINRLDFSCS
jgi:hypothetical protein